MVRQAAMMTVGDSDCTEYERADVVTGGLLLGATRYRARHARRISIPELALDCAVALQPASLIAGQRREQPQPHNPSSVRR